MTETSADDFRRALAFALRWEVGADKDGGYTNDPHDPGGETRWGISKRSYPGLDIRALSREQAEEIYFRDYWSASGVQRSFCSVLSWPLNIAHFDCTVNVGNWKVARTGEPIFHGRANMILQRAAGVEDDGQIGPITLRAIEAYAPRTLAHEAIERRDLYYDSLGAWADRYRGGWRNRTTDLRRLIAKVPA